MEKNNLVILKIGESVITNSKNNKKIINLTKLNILKYTL